MKRILLNSSKYLCVIVILLGIFLFNSQVQKTPLLADDNTEFAKAVVVSVGSNNYDIDESITRERKKNSLPVLDEFYKKVKNVYPHTVEKTHLHTAMTYAINNEKYLRYYIEDGRVEISNNSAERCCKSFVIGRKNILFSNSINGAKASGAAYSIIESAKMNGLKPYEYIEYILTRMAGKRLTEKLLKEIMPWSDQLPKILYRDKKA